MAALWFAVARLARPLPACLPACPTEQYGAVGCGNTRTHGIYYFGLNLTRRFDILDGRSCVLPSCRPAVRVEGLFLCHQAILEPENACGMFL